MLRFDAVTTSVFVFTPFEMEVTIESSSTCPAATAAAVEQIPKPIIKFSVENILDPNKFTGGGGLNHRLHHSHHHSHHHPYLHQFHAHNFIGAGHPATWQHLLHPHHPVASRHLHQQSAIDQESVYDRISDLESGNKTHVPPPPNSCSVVVTPLGSSVETQNSFRREKQKK